ncbi:Uncharacterized protein OS=Bradyrhizobium japonicum SEMIA 5079 GN=BJS_05842 PE=4 SV=1 [Gemmata massiliana]|uniref:ParB/Sulfiredoxin domain-containing protein n=1 Tax=Gemmata massiliana TaxID=1210884 RepID=A0A6P2CY96_9BACT|nr:ParB/RepB/Spo0J family partition protein [Gemmata massiliana]VTR92170.1 Uncharacterized protein OS=Bradyrhizobium japonicum SEMIA 5079 GN=BJS_05842 PE=4 SV=1 [Gemmata massiliana]
MKDLLPHPLAERYPLLNGEDYQEFKASIRANGQKVEIELFEGKILDGRNRYRACKELGIEPKTKTFVGTAEEAAVHSDALNLDRRHLTRDQKRAVIAYKLRSQPSQSDRSIAAEVKVDHKTVAAVRRTVQATGEIPQLAGTTRKGRDGRCRPAVVAKKNVAKKALVKVAANPPVSTNPSHSAPEACESQSVAHDSKVAATHVQTERDWEEIVRFIMPDLNERCAWQGNEWGGGKIVELVPYSNEWGFFHFIVATPCGTDGEGEFEYSTFTSHAPVIVDNVRDVLAGLGFAISNMIWRRSRTLPCATPIAAMSQGRAVEIVEEGPKPKPPGHPALAEFYDRLIGVAYSTLNMSSFMVDSDVKDEVVETIASCVHAILRVPERLHVRELPYLPQA